MAQGENATARELLGFLTEAQPVAERSEEGAATLAGEKRPKELRRLLLTLQPPSRPLALAIFFPPLQALSTAILPVFVCLCSATPSACGCSPAMVQTRATAAATLILKLPCHTGTPHPPALGALSSLNLIKAQAMLRALL